MDTKKDQRAKSEKEDEICAEIMRQEEWLAECGERRPAGKPELLPDRRPEAKMFRLADYRKRKPKSGMV